MSKENVENVVYTWKTTPPSADLPQFFYDRHGSPDFLEMDFVEESVVVSKSPPTTTTTPPTPTTTNNNKIIADAITTTKTNTSLISLATITTPLEIINLLEKNKIYGKFLPTPKNLKCEQLSAWLRKWIQNGSTPMVTLSNCAQFPTKWEHLIVVAMGGDGEITTTKTSMTTEALLSRLSSPPLIMIERKEVLKRAPGDLRNLARISQKWNDLNVLGQVAMVSIQQNISHIRLPVNVCGGITIFVQNFELLNFVDF